MASRVFKKEEREEKRVQMLETGFALLKEYGMTHMSVDKITSAVGLGKGTFYHFFDSKEDFVYQLIEHQRKKFWGYMEMLKDGREKMTEENGKFLLRSIILNEDSVYQYLSMNETKDVNDKSGQVPNLEEEAGILRFLFDNIENVRVEPNYGVISNLLKIMAMAAGSKKYLHESKYEETLDSLFGLLFREIFNS